MNVSTTISLNKMMQEMYELAHSMDNRVAKTGSRRLAIDGPVDLEVFLSGMQRQEYEARNREYEATKQKNCRLCWAEESLVYCDQVAIVPDGIPFFPYHMLLRPVRPECIDSTFATINSNVKRGVVDKAHLDCRPGFSFEDIVIMGRLVQDADHYMITQAMGGSGASIQEHIHAHAFLKTQTDFPLLNRVCFTLLNGTTNIWVNRHITYGLLIRDEPEVIATVFVTLKDHFGLPSNHYIRMDNAFGGLVGLYVPRVKQTPPLPRIEAVDWKFGTFEVLGLYDAKTPELYQTLTAEEACAATRSVTLQECQRQVAMEELCRTALV